MATLDEIRAEVIRQRGFIRAAETQGSKILAMIDEAPAPPVEPEPDPEPQPDPDPEPDPEPMPDPDPPSGAFVETFDFPSVDAMFATGRFVPRLWPNQGGSLSIERDAEGPFLRSNWGGGPYGAAGDEQLGCDVVLPAELRKSELWFEMWVRYSQGFRVNSDHKTFWYLTAAHHYEWRAGAFGNRMLLKVDNNLLAVAQAPGGGELDLRTAPDVWNDGQWHRHRLHLRTGSGGVMEATWDGKYPMASSQNFPAEPIQAVALFRNGDPTNPSTIDVRNLVVHSTDPGW